MSTALDEIQWKSPEWIQQFGLHTGNVLDYFSESPFYDRTSNNQVLKMQFQFQPPPPNITSAADFAKYVESKLNEMVGVEFVLAFIKEPDFWIVRKQDRLAADNVRVLQDYYIIGANVYQSPKLYHLINSRLLNSTLQIKNSINCLNELGKFKGLDDEFQSQSTTSNSTTATPFTPMRVEPQAHASAINLDAVLADTLGRD